MKRSVIIAALLIFVTAGCTTQPEPPWDGKIFDDNLRGTGPGWDQTRTGPPMPPPVSPAVTAAITAERRRQNVRYRPLTPHLLMQPGDTNKFVGPVPPSKL